MHDLSLVNLRISDTIIGAGAINKLPELVKSFTQGKILIVTDAGLVKAGVLDSVKAPLEEAGSKFDVYDGCREEPPMSIITELSRKVKAGDYKLLVGVGGGSVMDTTKVTSILAFNDMTVKLGRMGHLFLGLNTHPVGTTGKIHSFQRRRHRPVQIGGISFRVNLFIKCRFN